MEGNVSVIIPSLNPDQKLIQVVEGLIQVGFNDIILVNDGSDQAHMQPFQTVARYSQCTILTHEQNRGKGRALKTAFSYILKNRPNCLGVVTVDGDNQHRAKDIAACAEEPAQTLETQITISDGQDASVLKDQYVSSKLTLTPGTQITIESSSKIGSIYLIWDIPVPGWTLQADGKTSTHGKNGFLHEYVVLDRPFESITMQIPESGAVLCDITVLSPGTPPSNIQIWEPPLEKADLLLLSTHADDEHLFFGGTMPYYAGEKGLRVQLVYFCSHTMNEPYREHEKLNGMWLQGVKNYPVMGTFPDEYSMDLESCTASVNALAVRR